MSIILILFNRISKLYINKEEIKYFYNKKIDLNIKNDIFHIC
jgi:hypothetical protein